MLKSTKLIGFLILTVVVSSCDIKNSDIAPEASFVRIYESTNVSERYYPQDIIQMSDGKYLVLSALIDSSQINFPKVSLIALDETGEVIAQEVLPETLSNPVQGWIEANGKYLFICMDDLVLEARLFEAELNGESLTYTELQNLEKEMPLYTWSDGEDILLLSYDYDGRTYINKYDNNFNDQWEVSLNTGADFSGEIWNHMQKVGKPKPFFIDVIRRDDGSKDYMVNCLENYSLALVFLNGISGTVASGRVYSWQEETGLSAALHLEGDTFSLARFHSGNSYIDPKSSLSFDEIIMTKDFEDIHVSQLKADARMDILKYQHNNSNYIVYASTSKSNQIILLFFDAMTGEQVYMHTLGYGNPVEITNLKKSADDGLIVLGKTWINGQYQRIILYKIDKDQLDLD